MRIEEWGIDDDTRLDLPDYTGEELALPLPLSGAAKLVIMTITLLALGAGGWALYRFTPMSHYLRLIFSPLKMFLPI